MSDGLGYLFDPTPSWVQTDYESDSLSAERRDVLLAVFHRANVKRLMRGQPTPELRVESLADATRRPTSRAGLEALRHLLREMRRDGDLDYTTRGTGSRVVYVFSLTFDRSGVAPASDASSTPPSEKAQTGSGNGIAGTDDSDRSGVPDGDGTITAPGGQVSTPPSESPSNSLPEPDSGDDQSASTPGSLDVRENPRTASTGEETSARPREDELAEETLMDEFWASTAKPKRGYGWEPDS